MIQWIKVKECKEDYILSGDMRRADGSIIVAKYTVLNQHIVDLLLSQGIYNIKVLRKETTQNDSNSYKSQNIKKAYETTIRDMKCILCDLVSGKSIDTNIIDNITDNIMKHLEEGPDIIKVLEDEKEFDEYTYTHSLNVALYSMLIGRWLKLKKDQIKQLTIAGLLHDIGKIKVPYEILNKKGRLTKEEFEVIKLHTIYGYDFLKQQYSFSEDICQAVLLHHERMDKSGYPYGLGVDQIGLYSRIIAIADVYDAITTTRVYKARSTPFEAFEIFKTIEVKNLDPSILSLFMSKISTHYIGVDVLLNTGEVGTIVYVPPHNITDPIVKVDDEYVDFSRTQDKAIVELLKIPS
jgi:putative nucleotidyltransferase with HDIG domain